MRIRVKDTQVLVESLKPYCQDKQSQILSQQDAIQQTASLTAEIRKLQEEVQLLEAKHGVLPDSDDDDDTVEVQPEIAQPEVPQITTAPIDDSEDEKVPDIIDDDQVQDDQGKEESQKSI